MYYIAQLMTSDRGKAVSTLMHLSLYFMKCSSVDNDVNDTMWTDQTKFANTCRLVECRSSGELVSINIHEKNSGIVVVSFLKHQESCFTYDAFASCSVDAPKKSVTVKAIIDVANRAGEYRCNITRSVSGKNATVNLTVNLGPPQPRNVLIGSGELGACSHQNDVSVEAFLAVITLMMILFMGNVIFGLMFYRSYSGGRTKRKYTLPPPPPIHRRLSLKQRLETIPEVEIEDGSSFASDTNPAVEKPPSYIN